MKYSIYLAISLMLAPVAVVQADTSGPGPTTTTKTTSTGTRLPERAPLSKKERATIRYEAGLRQMEKAAQYEQQIRNESDEKKRASLQKKLAKLNSKSIQSFEKALNIFPRYHEVYASLGNALRSSGRSDESLAAYAEALKINPSYDEAIAYQAEAHLDLNRLEEAKEAYLTLGNNDPALAQQLHASMINWIAQRQANPDGLDSGEIDQFATWVTKQQASLNP